MNRSDKIEQVSASLFAVHRALAEAGLPKKDAKGQVKGNREYRYLSLPALIEHLALKLKDAQLYTTQEVKGGTGFVSVLTTVWHLSGQFIEFGPAYMPAAGSAQDVGAATTYARRYALAAVFNLAADEDTDASPGMGRKQEAMEPVAPAAGTASVGEAGAVPASLDQWANLLSLVDGKPHLAAKRINEKNGTQYTYQTAKAGATRDELEKAMMS